MWDKIERTCTQLDLVAELNNQLQQNVQRNVETVQKEASYKMKYNIPTDDKEIDRTYTTGVDSIMNSLPTLDPEVLEGFEV